MVRGRAIIQTAVSSFLEKKGTQKVAKTRPVAILSVIIRLACSVKGYAFNSRKYYVNYKNACEYFIKQLITGM